jgi:uncharacterized membrane protein YhdT
MITAQTIRKGAFLIAVTSLVFTIAAAIINYLYLDMTVLGAPTNYFSYSVLISVLPYLFVAIIALIVTVLANDITPAPKAALPPPENQLP